MPVGCLLCNPNLYSGRSSCVNSAAVNRKRDNTLPDEITLLLRVVVVSVVPEV